MGPGQRGKTMNRISKTAISAAISKKLLLGTALTTVAALIAPSAIAQNEIAVVTGSNIRGGTASGQPVTNISREKIESTAAVNVQQLLQNLAPVSTSFGSSGQTSGSFEPTP